MKSNFALLTLLVLTVAGCATTPPTSDQLRVAPQSQVYFLSQAKTNETAQAIFVRDSGALASLNFLHLYIDGKKAASLNTAEMVEVTLPKGEHVFGVVPTDPFGMRAIYSIDQELKPGRIYHYRLIITDSGVRIQREPDMIKEN